jgi:flavin-dependent dehydrogenase
MLPESPKPYGDALCDVLVIGGGPAGSTIAALLAERGRRVTLLEKDRHPRFHIGESLLPLNLPLFEKLGVKEAIERIGMLKYGVEFISPYHDKSVMFDFADAWDKDFPYSYQVRRSEFDDLLLRNAAAKGATVIEGTRATAVELPPEGGIFATSRSETGEARRWSARFLVDASGRDTFLASRLGLKQRNRKHGSAAIFGHFTGARRLSGNAAGNISICWFDHGWIWFIPLSDGTTSVGAVCRPQYLKLRRSDITSFFLETLATCRPLADRLVKAELIGPATTTGNYSYRSDRLADERFLLLGDAFAFIDPVFSTGVYLAMMSAFLGLDAIETALDRPAQAARALQRFESDVRRGIDSFSWYIYRMATPAMRDLFMGPRNYFRIEEAVLSFLAGDVFGRSPIQSRLFLFKLLYYFTSMLRLPSSLQSWRMRRQNVRVARAVRAREKTARRPRAEVGGDGR